MTKTFTLTITTMVPYVQSFEIEADGFTAAHAKALEIAGNYDDYSDAQGDYSSADIGAYAGLQDDATGEIMEVSV